MNLFDVYDLHTAAAIQQGAICVYPTETVYGIGASAFNKAAVEAVFTLKKRPANKPFAVLVADFSDVHKFDIASHEIERAKEFWPGPNTLIFNSQGQKWQYLHRGTHGLSFRIPAEPHFREFLRQTGPLATTSANLSGEPTITLPTQAFAVFGGAVQLYMQPSPWASGSPSNVIDVRGKKPKYLR